MCVYVYDNTYFKNLHMYTYKMMQLCGTALGNSCLQGKFLNPSATPAPMHFYWKADK
uniref:Uncharacterized protein n=1 Tax=Octopus bimaculoides TaxID=37653 RepID=A0A0L8IAX5_OCTBM